jgi:hypothetical protein
MVALARDLGRFNFRLGMAPLMLQSRGSLLTSLFKVLPRIGDASMSRLRIDQIRKERLPSAAAHQQNLAAAT